MSRTVIAAVVAVVIAVLTAIAFFVTSASFESEARKSADDALRRSHQLIGTINALDAIDVQNKAEWLASQPEFVKAINTANGTERMSQSRLGFGRFTSDPRYYGQPKPDIIALVDKEGNVLAMNDVPTVIPKQWRNEKGESILPAVGAVLSRRNIISDVWHKDDKTLMKIGVASIIDPDKLSASPDESAAIIGAVVVAYAQTAKKAQAEKNLLGPDVAYYDRSNVIASSFTRGGGEEDTSKAQALTAQLGQLNADKGIQISVGGADYLAAAVKLPQKATKGLPKDYSTATAGVVVLSPLVTSEAAGKVKLFILILGIGALALSMLGLYLAHRRLISQVDQVELGVNEIINGNLDRTFRPVGPELDGLSNALNVMLARLFGRPEPGEEEYDDEGNPIIPGRVEFEEGEEGRPAVDPDIAALAQEAEPDYYKRVYTEYVNARKASGTPDDVSFENFIAKLKVNEGKLKAQYQCKQVRFRVVTKDGKVSLKPVPIFA
jgi:hypothetical protein